MSSLKVGDRVQPHEAIGTIEKIRPSSPSSDGDYLVAEVLWDTEFGPGTRCAEPLAWLISLEDREAEREAEREAAKEQRRLERERRREQPERECDGCPRHFSPARKGQRFHSQSCRKRAHRLGIT